jgi:hypothetical protein
MAPCSNRPCTLPTSSGEEWTTSTTTSSTAPSSSTGGGSRHMKSPRRSGAAAGVLGATAGATGATPGSRSLSTPGSHSLSIEVTGGANGAPLVLNLSSKPEAPGMEVGQGNTNTVLMAPTQHLAPGHGGTSKARHSRAPQAQWHRGRPQSGAPAGVHPLMSAGLCLVCH